MVERSMPRSALIEGGDGTRGQQAKSDKGSRVARSGSGLCTSASPKGESRALQAFKGVFDMPAPEGLASEPGSGQPELGPERPVALFDVGVWFESG
jgi:hypothetical protein